MKQFIAQNSRKDSDPFVDTAQQSSKFKDYIEQKVQKIQDTKLKTIKMTEKYFTQLKEKMDKYLAKEQKKILNAYEDNINMSINCMNHHYLYDFETILFKNGKTERKTSKEFSLAQTDQQPRKKSYESQNQLTIKIQVKRLIEEMLLAETHLSQTVKLIGQQLKSDLQKIVQPLGQLFSKIPKLTQVTQNSSTLLIKELPSTNEKKKGKNLNKLKKNQSFNVKNPQISAQKIQISNVQSSNDLNLSLNMTEKLLNKSNMQKESIRELRFHENNKILKLKLQKQDKTALILNKKSKETVLIDFDFINSKSLFYVYQKEVHSQNFNHEVENQEREKPKTKYQITLNERTLLQESLNKTKYEGFCKIEFESKPDRQYLAVLTSKQFTVEKGQNIRKYKSYQMTIFNYKGDTITKDLVSNLKLNETENPVKIFQLPCLRQFVFIVLNNRIKRYSLTNLWKQKTKLFPIDQKIIKAQVNDDKIILYEGRKSVFYLINSDLTLMQTFMWDSIYPVGVMMASFINIKIQRPNQKETESLTVRNRYITLMILRTPIDTLYYFENNLIKKLDLQMVRQTFPSKLQSLCLKFIYLIHEIYPGVYLILSRRNGIMKTKSDLFIMEISPEKNISSEENQTLKGTISYLDTINEEYHEARFIKNQLYLTLRTGKTIAYSLC